MLLYDVSFKNHQEPFLKTQCDITALRAPMSCHFLGYVAALWHGEDVQFDDKQHLHSLAAHYNNKSSNKSSNKDGF